MSAAVTNQALQVSSPRDRIVRLARYLLSLCMPAFLDMPQKEDSQQMAQWAERWIQGDEAITEQASLEIVTQILGGPLDDRGREALEAASHLGAEAMCFARSQSRLGDKGMGGVFDLGPGFSSEETRQFRILAYLFAYTESWSRARGFSRAGEELGLREFWERIWDLSPEHAIRGMLPKGDDA
jgi:hypothetical protein